MAKELLNKREFLHLAHKYRPDKDNIGGWYFSLKLDGQRCWWDGGITRGILKSLVPWANLDKDNRYKEEQLCTGLWTRYGNVIHASSDWLDKLPPVPLDGELYMGINTRQDLRKIIGRLKPYTEDWAKVKYHIFDLPPYSKVLETGRIYGKNFTKNIDWEICEKFIQELPIYKKRRGNSIKANTFFEEVLKTLQNHTQDPLVVIRQIKLPIDPIRARNRIFNELEKVEKDKGEGLVVRSPHSFWFPKRSHEMLKVKQLHDDEATIIGFRTGKMTDKGSQHLGKIGALIVEWKGKRFELGGLNNSERDFKTPKGTEWALCNAGKECPSWIKAKSFTIGEHVTFKYRGQTKDEIPTETYYWRKWAEAE